MSGRLQGKVAIVTGAGCVGPGWGNGRAAAVRFVEEGASVLAVDRNPAALAETLERAGANAAALSTHECDVTNSAAVQRMASACMETYGCIDILVNNVGGSAKGGCRGSCTRLWSRPGWPDSGQGAMSGLC